MGLGRLLKSWIVPQLIIGYVFVVSGCIICILMLLSCVVWPFNKHLYRKINVYLGYSFWSQLAFVAQWWSGTEVRLYIDPEAFKTVGKEHVLVLMNHKYDIDWLMTWILSERVGILGGCKFYGKEPLKYLPLLGWSWYFTESIFLKRQWEHDREVITRYIKRVLDYPKNFYSTILLFPEGTRFTKEKLKASNEVCRAKGYPETKHTLLPRTKGFVLSMHGIQGKVSSILDCTVAFPRDGPAPTLMNIAKGVPMMAHFSCVRIPLEEVPVDTDEACGAWLRSQFKKKDELYDCFLKTGKFAGPSRIVPRRLNDLMMWLFWALLTCVPLFYYIAGIFLAGTLLQQFIFFVILGVGSVAVRLMIGVSETKKGSAYGKNADTVNGTAHGREKSVSQADNGSFQTTEKDTELDTNGKKSQVAKKEE